MYSTFDRIIDDEEFREEMFNKVVPEKRGKARELFKILSSPKTSLKKNQENFNFNKRQVKFKIELNLLHCHIYIINK